MAAAAKTKKVYRPATLDKWHALIAKPTTAIDWICEQIEEGNTLENIAGRLGITSMSLRRWLSADESRSARAMESRAASAAAWDNQALNGILAASNPLDLAKAREAAHHMRWRAAKINPTQYGDKATIDLTVTSDDLLMRLAAERKSS